MESKTVNKETILSVFCFRFSRRLALLVVSIISCTLK